MKTKKILAFALVLALVFSAVAFSGCAKQGAVEKIKKAGKLVMLTNAGFAPYEFLGSEGTPIGVDVEICKAIAAELGVELEVVDMDFDGIVLAIQSGKGDLGAAGMTADDERRKSVDFSINYVDATQKIIVADGGPVASADDLAGKNIGVQMGTTGDIFVTDNIEGANVSRYKTGPDAGAELANGKLDAVVIDDMPAQQIADANGLTVLADDLTEEQYAIAIAKGNTDLKEVVDKVLAKLLADGTIDAWIAEYNEISKNG